MSDGVSHFSLFLLCWGEQPPLSNLAVMSVQSFSIRLVSIRPDSADAPCGITGGGNALDGGNKFFLGKTCDLLALRVVADPELLLWLFLSVVGKGERGSAGRAEEMVLQQSHS